MVEAPRLEAGTIPGGRDLVIPLGPADVAAIGAGDLAVLGEDVAAALAGLAAFRAGGAADVDELGALAGALSIRLLPRLEAIRDAAIRAHRTAGGSVGQLAAALDVARSTAQSRREALTARPPGPGEAWVRGSAGDGDTGPAAPDKAGAGPPTRPGRRRWVPWVDAAGWCHLAAVDEGLDTGDVAARLAPGARAVGPAAASKRAARAWHTAWEQEAGQREARTAAPDESASDGLDEGQAAGLVAGLLASLGRTGHRDGALAALAPADQTAVLMAEEAGWAARRRR